MREVFLNRWIPGSHPLLTPFAFAGEGGGTFSDRDFRNMPAPDTIADGPRFVSVQGEGLPIMNTFCLSCRVPLGSADTHCPACGTQAGQTSAEPPPRRVLVSAAPVNDGPPSSVPGRVATGTVVRSAVVRHEPIMSRNFLWAARIAAVLTALTVVPAVAARAPAGELLLVLGGAAVSLLVPGILLRSSMSASVRRSAGGPGWPWTLPLRPAAGADTGPVSSIVVKDVEGAEHTCVARGTFVPRPPAAGAMVEVYGRRDRVGKIVVRQLVSAGTGDIVTPRSPIACRLQRAAECAAVAVWAATACALLVASIR
ncbi:hypothetical protein [Amycolatopsis australiensis]|uniref:hypothetical protein n=1 Tax=Amycolatopsis australiensis TaxID=546364 RepID=UPI001160EDE6|nr:hypothetical protein [Amycolatopsis australiensis]